MIQILNIFDTLLRKLQSLKSGGIILKFLIEIDQRNQINVITVSSQKVNKEEIGEPQFEYSNLSLTEISEDYYYSDLFQSNDEIVSYKKSRRKLTNLLDPVSNFNSEIPIITYYSYKGGMGRSTNLMLTSTYLARHYQKKVVIIDCDFEAPGFSNFFLENPGAPRNQNGLLEYFFDSEIESNLNLNNYSWEVSKEFSKDGEIRIIPAGNLSIQNLDNEEFSTDLNHYLEGLSRLDFSSTEYIISKFEAIIKTIINQINPDVIFIDSRTGFTDILGITGFKLATHIVGFFSNSVQNLPGIYHFIDNVKYISENKTKSDFRTIIVNSFSTPTLFEDFKSRVDDYISTNSLSSEDGLLIPEYFYFPYEPELALLGTSMEIRENWLKQIDRERIGEPEIAKKLNSFINEFKNEKASSEIYSPQLIDKYQIEEQLNSFNECQSQILTKLRDNWPDLYADNGEIDFNGDFIKGKFFYRESMKDIFNFQKFLITGSKGTGKSYLFQALKNENIVNRLKELAQKKHLNIHFLHLVDKTHNYFISTSGFSSFKDLIEKIGENDFYRKFWKVYTWKAIVDEISKGEIAEQINFKTKVPINFSIKNNDTEMKEMILFISDIENIILVEKELESIDSLLNSKQIDIIAIYDNLDLMVEPIDWKYQMASLINFWEYSNFKRIHSKLFVRTDLFKRIVGLNNSQALVNKTISIEWKKEEIFNYFFNLVRIFAKSEFISTVKFYDFESESDDATTWIDSFHSDFKTENQKDFDEFTLRKLCWVFFGRYPDIKAHGESYDWLYKNVMNADETISLRPFIDLLKLSIDEFFKDQPKDNSAVLPSKYYTNKNVRKGAVNKHFEDLVIERGNESLRAIFEFIDDTPEYRYYEFWNRDFQSLLSKAKEKNTLIETLKELEELLIINGIVRKIPMGQDTKYTFAFLYKYRLGLGSRGMRRKFR
ncbi:cellulose biosynthesis protein BcsQ [Arcicella rosea]|uniref:KGGVGR-motif variant AAA ATPase n=1 Tax=Arcicella rosea TaxID=502909 RepID=UPI00345C9456